MSKLLFRVILGSVLLLTLLFIAGVVAVLLLSTNDEDTSHSFASPSGARTLYLIESCQGSTCTHQAVIEIQGADSGTVQIRCGLDIVADRPVFSAVEVDWSPNEDAVTIRYALMEEGGSVYALDLGRDCNA